MVAPAAVHAMLLLMALMLLPGCGFLTAATGQYHEPAFRVVSTKVESITPERLRIKLGLEIVNDNPYALTVSDLHYALEISDTPLAEGDYLEPLEVGASAAQTVQLSIDMHLGTLMDSVLRTLSLGELPYRLTASANVGAYFLSRPISHSETSVLRIVPPYGLGRWLERLGLGGASHSG